MSMEYILKQIMEDQSKLAADVWNNQLVMQYMDKQFGQFAVPEIPDQKGVCREILTQTQNK